MLSFDHRSFDQLNMSNHSLSARGTDPPFSHKSVVSNTHEQNIICSKPLICRQLLCRSRGELSANEKEGKMHRMIIEQILYLVFLNLTSSRTNN